MASFLVVVPLLLVLVAIGVLVWWVKYRANRHADNVGAVEHPDPRERELEAIRREHRSSAAGVDRSSGTDIDDPAGQVPPLRRSEPGAPGQSGARVPYPEGAGPDADPLAWGPDSAVERG